MTTKYLIFLLLVLMVANLLMLYGYSSEGFSNFQSYTNPAPMGQYDLLRLADNTPGNNIVALSGPEPGPDDLFLFKNNVSKPACCPAQYSSSTGCVCMSDKQKVLLMTRGGNRPYGNV
jgi:hypothetical protein